MDRGKRFFLFLFLMAAAFFLVYYFDLSSLLSISKIQEEVNSYGAFAPVAFTLIYVVATIIFLPGTPLTVASGILFGTWLGTFYTVIGATIGAVIAFYVARFLGAAYVEDKLKSNFKKIYEYDKKLEEKGFLIVLFLRLVPIFPFNGLNFALGLTRVRSTDYIFATFVGIIPGSFALAFFGGSVASLNPLNIALAVALFVLLSISPSIHKWVKKRRVG